MRGWGLWPQMWWLLPISMSLKVGRSGGSFWNKRVTRCEIQSSESYSGETPVPEDGSGVHDSSGSGLDWFGGSAWTWGLDVDRSPGRLPDPSFAAEGGAVGAGSQRGVWTQAAARHCDASKPPGGWHVPPHQGQVQVGREDAGPGLRALCVQPFRTRAAEDTGPWQGSGAAAPAEGTEQSPVRRQGPGARPEGAAGPTETPGSSCGRKGHAEDLGSGRPADGGGEGQGGSSKKHVVGARGREERGGREASRRAGLGGRARQVCCR